jgi:excisionase family DNA binding protein
MAKNEINKVPGARPGTDCRSGDDLSALMNDADKFLTAPEKFLTVKEAAALLRKSPSAIRSWIDAGKLRAVRVGGTLYVSRCSIGEMVRSI